MPFDLMTLIGGAIAGGIAAFIVVTRMNKQVRQHACPHCCQALGDRKPGKRTLEQVLMGGWTCPDCGCDVDRHGNQRKK